MTAEPRLAESFEPDAGGTRWRFRLRAATWHDGRPLTGEDVLFTLRRITDPATTATAAALFSPVDLAASRASGRDVEIVLRAPNHLLPLAFGAPGTEIVPAGTTGFTNPVGTGPFRFVSFTPGGACVYARNDAYWDGAPPSPELEFTPIDDEQARLGALLSGQVAYAHDLRPASARTLAQDPGRAVLLSAPGATTQFLNLRVDRPPFADPRLREAVRLGIDRDALVRIVLLGTGSPGTDLFGRPGQRYFPPGAVPVARDAGRARELVRAAGADGTVVELQTSTVDPNFGPAATLVAEQLAEIGLRVTPRVLDPQTYFTSARTVGTSSFTRTGTLPIPDYIGRRRLTGATENRYTGFASAEVDRRYAAAVANPDEDGRAAELVRIQEILRAGSGALVWAASDWHVGVATGVSGIANATPNSLRWARFDRAAAG
nr:ABC transporter substrate-binding protein [Pseudonocardia sp. HH130630-07]